MQPDEDILHDGRDITKRVKKLRDTAINMKNCRRNDAVSLRIGALGFGWCCIITMRDKQQRDTGAISGSAVMHPTTGTRREKPWSPGSSKLSISS
jgi:hypothetical protein